MATPAEQAWTAAHEHAVDQVAALGASADDDMPVQVRLVNAPLARLAEELAPPYPWPTDEPFPREAFHAMWKSAYEHRKRTARVWDLDRTTLPLFEDWIEAIEQHIAEAA